MRSVALPRAIGAAGALEIVEELLAEIAECQLGLRTASGEGAVFPGDALADLAVEPVLRGLLVVERLLSLEPGDPDRRSEAAAGQLLDRAGAVVAAGGGLGHR